MQLKKLIFFFILIFISLDIFCQEIEKDSIVDSKYREDQFYVGVNYNLVTNVPSDLKLKGVSGGIHFGFLRDIPINEQRNVAIALGLGFSFDRYGQTLFIGEDESEVH